MNAQVRHRALDRQRQKVSQSSLKKRMIARLVIMYFINRKKSRTHLAISAKMPSQTLFCRKRTTRLMRVARMRSEERMLFRFLTLPLQKEHLAHPHQCGSPSGIEPFTLRLQPQTLRTLTTQHIQHSTLLARMAQPKTKPSSGNFRSCRRSNFSPKSRT